MTGIYEKYRACADKLEQSGFYSRTGECHRPSEGGQGDGLGETGLPAQVEEGGGVPGGVGFVEILHHRLVAGGLHIPAEEPVGHP